MQPQTRANEEILTFFLTGGGRVGFSISFPLKINLLHQTVFQTNTILQCLVMFSDQFPHMIELIECGFCVFVP